MKHRYAMTRRDVGMLRIFTSQTTLRENTQPYRFWGLKIFTPLTLRFQDFQRRNKTILRISAPNADVKAGEAANIDKLLGGRVCISLISKNLHLA
jgi:hypothetical protein